jgi:hypothetical protein
MTANKKKNLKQKQKPKKRRKGEGSMFLPTSEEYQLAFSHSKYLNIKKF